MEHGCVCSWSQGFFWKASETPKEEISQTNRLRFLFSERLSTGWRTNWSKEVLIGSNEAAGKAAAAIQARRKSINSHKNKQGSHSLVPYLTTQPEGYILWAQHP